MSSFRFRWSIVGIAVGLAYYGSATIGNLDGFESVLSALRSWDQYELDELLIAMLAIMMFFFLDCVSLVQERKYEKQRVETYRATMESTHHILNNFLNQAQILELAVENDPKIDPEVIEMYHQTVNEAISQLEQLDRLNSIEPDKIRKAVYPQQDWGARVEATC